MNTLNLRLILVIIFVSFCGLSQSVKAQSVSAEPVTSVAEETLKVPVDPMAKGAPPIVVELFSSQACVFCPQADRYFGDLIKQPNIIGLACHVSYFDVRQGSLSQKFCTKRQSWYMKTLKAGPNYTPQIVVNGHIDVVGYKYDDVGVAMQAAAMNGIERLNLRKHGQGYVVSLPEKPDWQKKDMTMWLALYDKPHNVTIAEGRNRGKQMTYYNVLSAFEDLGAWNGTAEEKTLMPLMKGSHEGFVFMVQDNQTGEILAVAKI